MVCYEGFIYTILNGLFKSKCVGYGHKLTDVPTRHFPSQHDVYLDHSILLVI